MDMPQQNDIKRSISKQCLLEENLDHTIHYEESHNSLWKSILPSLDTILIVAGIYGSFIPFGYYQEKIFKFVDVYTDEPFQYSIFFVYVLLTVNAVVASIVLTLENSVFSFLKPTKDDANVESMDNGTESKTFLEKYLFSLDYSILYQIYYIAVTYSTSIIATNIALSHIDYPTQVLFKSAKTIPVILGGRFFFKKKYPYFDYITVCVVAVALTTFNYNGQKKSGTGANSYLGLGLLFLSLFCDAITGPRQDHLNSKAKLSSNHYMYLTNAFSCVLTFIVCIILEGPHNGFNFFLHNRKAALYLLIATLSHSIGQLFIFWALAVKGSLQLSLLTTTRKCFTVFLSVKAFNHTVTNIQWVCILIIFLALIYQSLCKELAKRNRK